MSWYKPGDFIVWSRRWSIHCGKVVQCLPSYNLKVHEYSVSEKEPQFYTDGRALVKIVKTSRIIKVKEL